MSFKTKFAKEDQGLIRDWQQYCVESHYAGWIAPDASHWRSFRNFFVNNKRWDLKEWYDSDESEIEMYEEDLYHLKVLCSCLGDPL